MSGGAKRQCDRALKPDRLRRVGLGDRQRDPPRAVLEAVPEVRPLRRRERQCRFRKSGTEYIRESGMKRMSGGAKRQCDRALGLPCVGRVLRALERLQRRRQMVS